MKQLLKNQRNISIILFLSVIISMVLWYYGFHQNLSYDYNIIKKSKNNLTSKRDKYKRMKNEISSIQEEWDFLNEEFETVIKRVPNKTNFDNVSNSLYNLIKNSGLSIINYSPSRLAIDKKTIILPDGNDQIIIEKIPIDIEVRGSYVSFGQCLESMAESRYRLTASHIEILKKSKEPEQAIKFIAYAYFQSYASKTSSMAQKPTKKQKVKEKIIPKKKPQTQSKISNPNSQSNVYHEIVIRDSKICKNISNNKPYDSGTKFSTDIGRVYCHSLLDNNDEKSNAIYHNWYMNGQLKAKVRIRIKSGKNIPAISYRDIKNSDAGEWKVEIIDSDKKILETIIFELV
tara:strand:+ start:68 stop:1102 length:1035 start_codon:yes stop_codon:yes gene_type:complete